MKAVVQDRYGPLEVLGIRDIDVPPMGADDVLVRVRAASVDRAVWHLVTGTPYLVRVAMGLRSPRFRVPGRYLAGRVEAVGANVTRLRPGDDVFGACDSTFAEYVSAPEHRFVAKPGHLSFEEAAAIPHGGLAALQALRDAAGVEGGQSVLVIGAAGAVGGWAVQIAKSFGTHVTGVCSTAKVDLVLSLGADEAVDYTREDFAAGTRRYDVILDTAGVRPLSDLRRALAPQGVLVLVGGEGGGRWMGPMGRSAGALFLSPFVRQRLRPFLAVPTSQDLAALKQIIESGKLTPLVDRTYPLHEAAQALRHVGEGHARGTTVLTI